MNAIRPPSPRAFTLIELILSITVISILAASAAPALRTLSATREGAAAGELRRLLQTARSTAVSSGRPAGLACAQDSTLARLTIENPDDPPTTLASPLGEPFETFSLPSLFPEVRITQARSGLGDIGSVTFWFAEDGTPHSRTPNGAERPAWTTDGAITLTGGTQIFIRRVSGAIE